MEFGIYVFQKRVVSFSLRKIQFQNELAFIPSKKGVLMELLLWYLLNHSIVQLNVFFLRNYILAAEKTYCGKTQRVIVVFYWEQKTKICDISNVEKEAHYYFCLDDPPLS